MRQITSVHAVCAFASIGGGLFGYDIASMSAVLGTSSYLNFFNNPKSSLQGLITCCMPFGSIFGAILTSVVADRFSRKTAIQLACVLWIIGSAYVLRALTRPPSLADGARQLPSHVQWLALAVRGPRHIRAGRRHRLDHRARLPERNRAP